MTIIKLESKEGIFKERYFKKLTDLVEIINKEGLEKISYHTVYNKKFPFDYKGYRFSKHPLEVLKGKKIEQK